MGTGIEGLRIALKNMLDCVYQDKEILDDYGHYSVDDVINQVIMEYIVKEYHVYAERKSISKHRAAHGSSAALHFVLS